MTRISTVFLLVTCSITTLAQESNYLQSRYMLERMGNLSPTSTVIPGTPSTAPSVVGDSFLNKNFAKATFLFFTDNKSSEFYAKYDLARDVFYLLSNSKIYALDGRDVKNFSWTDSVTNQRQSFISGKLVKNSEGTPLVGFLEILSDGPIPLLKRNEAVIKEPNYRVAHGVGSKDYRVFKKSQLYYISDDVLRELPKGKKARQVLTAHAADVDNFIKVNDLDLSREHHLIALFNFYNQKFGASGKSDSQ